MGMDVYGKKPKSEAGRYFRRNVWGWRPLAELTLGLGPVEITEKCRYWHSNDGDGLGARDSVKLAKALDEALGSGDVADWITLRDWNIAQLPNEKCSLCDGTGIRTDKVGQEMRQPERVCDSVSDGEPHPRAGQKGWCNGCDGRGWNPPMAASYHVDVEDVKEWIVFLRDCGGFEIC